MSPSRLTAGTAARLKRLEKIVWRPIVRAVRPRLKSVGKATVETQRQIDRAVHAAGRSTLGYIGWALLPPWRCPGCGGLRKRRRLARCGGVVAAPYHRRLAFATGCPSCGLLYVSPAPPRRRHEQLYSEDGAWATGHPQTTDAVAGKHFIEALDSITGFRTPRDGAAVLDVGCGHGRWLNTFQQFGWKTFGIDPALKSAFRRHVELTEIPSDARFDFVVLSHVLEHLPNPGEMLAAAGRATRPGGWVYVGVPGLDALPSHGDWRYVLNANAHIQAYSLACLTELLRRSGFGTPSVLTLSDGKAAFRLRVVAQKTGAGTRAARPLDAAVSAIAAFRGNQPASRRPQGS